MGKFSNNLYIKSMKFYLFRNSWTSKLPLQVLKMSAHSVWWFCSETKTFWSELNLLLQTNFFPTRKSSRRRRWKRRPRETTFQSKNEIQNNCTLIKGIIAILYEIWIILHAKMKVSGNCKQQKDHSSMFVCYSFEMMPWKCIQDTQSNIHKKIIVKVKWDETKHLR